MLIFSTLVARYQATGELGEDHIPWEVQAGVTGLEEKWIRDVPAAAHVWSWALGLEGKAGLLFLTPNATFVH